MNHTPAYVLRTYLIDQGQLSVGGAGGTWPAWVSFLPGSPDEAVALYDDPSFLDAREMRGGDIIEHPTIVIKLRTRDYAAGWLKMYDMMQALNAVLRTTVTANGTSYLLQSVNSKTGVVAVGRDADTQRNEFEMTMNVTIQQL